MSKITVITLSLLFVVFSAGCAKQPAENTQPTAQNSPEPKQIASVDVVNVSASETEVTRGGENDVTIRLSIKNGYHVNANPPTYPYLKATQLEFPPQSGAPLAVAYTKYPPAVSKKFPFAEQPLAIYEGEITMTARVKADKSVKAGPQSLTGKLNVQACDDQVCYAPGTIVVTLPLKIK